MGFHSFAGLWAADINSLLGSSSRSWCPCLNFLNHSESRVQDRAPFPQAL
jgi:hypothetical protein